MTSSAHRVGPTEGATTGRGCPVPASPCWDVRACTANNTPVHSMPQAPGSPGITQGPGRAESFQWKRVMAKEEREGKWHGPHSPSPANYAVMGHVVSL